MAEVVDDSMFPEHPGVVYPWTKWLDGRVWRLLPDVDFTVSAESFRALAGQTARKRGLRLRTSIRPDGSVIIKSDPR
jgi:hypothetical protein